MSEIYLTIVRHGQSEANVATTDLTNGRRDTQDRVYKNRSTADIHLTQLGNEQLKCAGELLQKQSFDKYYVSPYLRALESALCLNLPGAHWEIDPLLAERDWRELEATTDTEIIKLEHKVGEALKINPFFCGTPHIESLASVNIRVQLFLQKLKNNPSKRTIVVGHGEWMQTCRAHLLHYTQNEFKETFFNEEKIGNGEFHQYTINPDGTTIYRSTCVYPELKMSGPDSFFPKKYSNQKLAQLIAEYPPAVIS